MGILGNSLTQQPKSREEARMLGLPEWQIKTMFPDAADGPAPGTPAMGALPAGQQDKGFWQGGDKFRAKDGIAGLLAVVGDALMSQAGGQTGATGLLGQGRIDARALAEKKAQEQQQLARMMAVGEQIGLTPAQVQAQAMGLKVPRKEKPYRYKDNAGNLMEIGPDGKPALVARDPSERVYFQNGAMVRVPNPYPVQQPTDTVAGQEIPIPRLGMTPDDRLSQLRAERERRKLRRKSRDVLGSGY